MNLSFFARPGGIHERYILRKREDLITQRRKLQCLFKVKDDFNKLSIGISTCYNKCLIRVNCQDRCSTYDQRYHCDRQKKLKKNIL